MPSSLASSWSRIGMATRACSRSLGALAELGVEPAGDAVHHRPDPGAVGRPRPGPGRGSPVRGRARGRPRSPGSAPTTAGPSRRTRGRSRARRRSPPAAPGCPPGRARPAPPGRRPARAARGSLVRSPYFSSRARHDGAFAISPTTVLRAVTAAAVTAASISSGWGCQPASAASTAAVIAITRVFSPRTVQKPASAAVSSAVAAGSGHRHRRAQGVGEVVLLGGERVHRGDLAGRPQVGGVHRGVAPRPRRAVRRPRRRPPPRRPAASGRTRGPSPASGSAPGSRASMTVSSDWSTSDCTRSRASRPSSSPAPASAEAVVEDRQPAQRAPLGLGEQVPRPVDDREQGLVPVGRAAVAAAQQREPVVEPPVDVLHRHHPHLGRGELDRERQPVEAAYDAAYGVVLRAARRAAPPTRAGGTGPRRRPRRAGRAGRPARRRSPSGARVVVTTRSRRHDATRNATRSATASTTCSQLSRIRSVGRLVEELGDAGADVVALLGGEHPAAADRVAHAERRADLADDVLGRGDADQLDEVHDRLLGPAAEQVRQPGLAEPARAEDRGDPRLADRRPQRPDVLVAADQGGRLEPQPLAHRAGRRPAARRAPPGAPGPGRRRAGRRGPRDAARTAPAPPVRRAPPPSSAAARRRTPRRWTPRGPRAGAAGAPPRGRPAPTAPARAPAPRSRGAVRPPAGARRAVPRRRCRARAAPAPRGPGRGPGRGRAGPRPRAAPTTASRSASASTASAGAPSR